jgi:hypothetical protein
MTICPFCGGWNLIVNACGCDPNNLPTPVPPDRKLWWTEEEAGANADPRRCVHGVPLNVFCPRCEA